MYPLLLASLDVKLSFHDPALLPKMTCGPDYEWNLFREIYPGLVQWQAHIHKRVCTDCIRKGKQWGIPSLGPFKWNLYLTLPTLFSPGPLPMGSVSEDLWRLIWGRKKSYLRKSTLLVISRELPLAVSLAWASEVHRLLGILAFSTNLNLMVLALSLFTSMHWRRKWQPTPVFLPGESQGWGSLVGCRLWGRTESDTTEVT